MLLRRDLVVRHVDSFSPGRPSLSEPAARICRQRTRLGWRRGCSQCDTATFVREDHHAADCAAHPERIRRAGRAEERVFDLAAVGLDEPGFLRLFMKFGVRPASAGATTKARKNTK